VQSQRIEELKGFRALSANASRQLGASRRTRKVKKMVRRTADASLKLQYIGLVSIFYLPPSSAPAPTLNRSSPEYRSTRRNSCSLRLYRVHHRASSSVPRGACRSPVDEPGQLGSANARRRRERGASRGSERGGVRRGEPASEGEGGERRRKNGVARRDDSPHT